MSPEEERVWRESPHWQNEINSTEKLIARKAADEALAKVVAWLRGMTATKWNALPGDRSLPVAFMIADAIESRKHLSGDRER